MSSNVSKVTQSTNNDWDSDSEWDSDGSTTWIESRAADAQPGVPEPVKSSAKTVQNTDPDPNLIVFELTWRDPKRNGTGIAKAYIDSQYGPEIKSTPLDNDRISLNTKLDAWGEMVESLHKHGLNIASRRLGDMEGGEYLKSTMSNFIMCSFCNLR